jgi:hypothetical protein
MSYIVKNWINTENIYSSDFNNMELGISTAVTHSTSTGSVHGIITPVGTTDIQDLTNKTYNGIINPVGTTDTQTLTGKSVSSSTDYLTSLIRNIVVSTSTGATTASGDILYIYTP